MSSRIGVLCLVLLVGSSLPAVAEPPEIDEVLIRYRIVASRNARVRAYYQFAKFLTDHGFRRDPNELINDDEPEDSKHIYLRGTLPDGKARPIVQQRNIQAILFRKSTQPMPEDPMQLVRVDITIKGGLDIQRQRELNLQTIQVLSSLGFKRADAYDHRNYRRIVGVIRAEQVEKLITEMRSHPAAWRLLNRTVLSDIRVAPNGNALLSKILEGWYDYPASKPLVEDLITEWESHPGSARVIQSLPLEVVTNKDKTVYKEFLLRDIISNPEAKEPLAKLLDKVLASPAAPDLMKQFLEFVAPVAPRLPLPLLFKSEPVVRLVEVLPASPSPSTQGPPKPVAEELEKIAPDLRAIIADGSVGEMPVRMEVVLAEAPPNDNDDWIRMFHPTKSFVEGRLGNVVTFVGPVADAKTLASSLAVTSVRFPRPITPIDSLTDDAVVGQLRQLGGVRRIAIIASDFQGWEGLVGKELPEDTKLIDITSELDPAIRPSPYPNPSPIGVGTRAAKEVFQAVPKASITLIRIAHTMPYMLEHVAKAINSGDARSVNLTARQYEVDRDDGLLQKEQEALLEERKVVLSNLEQEGEAAKKRDEYFEKQKAFEAKRKAYLERLRRYLKLVGDIQNLRNIEAVWCLTSWNVGFAQGGISPLSRYLDDTPFKKIWLQSVAALPRQSWQGVFLDRDDNQRLEFAPPEASLPPGALSKEYNFLAWEGATPNMALDLPANAIIRIAVQWREVQDPYYTRVGQDPYLKPKANLQAKVLFQPDPTGEKRPRDDLEWVAQEGGPARRLERFSNRSVYEQTVIFKVLKPGRYVFRLEGSFPSGYKPNDPSALNQSEVIGELKPRVFVQTLAGPGRAILRDFYTPEPALGMPGDSRRAKVEND